MFRQPPQRSLEHELYVAQLMWLEHCADAPLP